MDYRIRHCGFLVQNIDWVSSVLEKLNFFIIYDGNEYYQGCTRRIKKYKSDNLVIELIQGFNIYNNSCHISLSMDIPFWMLNDRSYIVQGYKNPNDPSLEVTFVYINDSIYFEFVKEKI
jgi:hypothetical protein